MKTRTVTLILSALALTGQPQESKLEGRVAKVVDNSIIYEKPTGTSKRLVRLSGGETVHIFAKADGDFWEVEYGDVRGFIHDLLLEKDASKKSTPGLPPEPNFFPGVHRMGSGITPPTVVKQVAPFYSNDALTNKVEGTVLLEVVILSTGTIGSVRVAKGLPWGLTDKAIECVRQWEFVPAELDGEPVDVVAEIEVSFEIVESGKE